MTDIYLGRIVAFAVTPEGNPAAIYRVSSRSFPNRMATLSEDGSALAIVPKPGHETDVRRNPYIAYNALRLVRDYAVLTNGSQTDPVSEKIAAGYPVRDAIGLTLLAMDYEKDSLDTPRIVSVADLRSRVGYLGVVRKDGIDVRAFELEPGTMVHLSTYEHNIPTIHNRSAFTANTAAEACDFALTGGDFAHFLNPVTAVAAVAVKGAFTVAYKDFIAE
ncbi:MAG: IMP cyclohydrolase [Planctomycetaceae bacterium]|nr:IMP cyclohydrolase [Planctomycetaceae bacterium]